MSDMFSVFEYLYRDASNYKAWGQILLSGEASVKDCDSLINALESGQFFVAERVNIPPLYQELWVLNGGPTNDDHSWHEFVELRPASIEETNEGLAIWGTVQDLMTKFQSLTDKKPKLIH